MFRPYISPPYQEQLDGSKYAIVKKGLCSVQDVIVVNYELWKNLMTVKENQNIVSEMKSE